jgi:hypothetical protein
MLPTIPAAWATGTNRLSHSIQASEMPSRVCACAAVKYLSVRGLRKWNCRLSGWIVEQLDTRFRHVTNIATFSSKLSACSLHQIKRIHRIGQSLRRRRGWVCPSRVTTEVPDCFVGLRGVRATLAVPRGQCGWQGAAIATLTFGRSKDEHLFADTEPLT